MVATLTPLAIVLGVVGTIGSLVLHRLGTRGRARSKPRHRFVNGFGTDIERANISAARERVATVIVITTFVAVADRRDHRAAATSCTRP